MKFISKKDIRLPKRKAGSRKGDNGYVLVVGGSRDFTGAAALAGLAALRSGADGAHIAAPEKVAWAINALSPDLVTIKLKGDYFSGKHVGVISGLAKKRDVVLLGNGIGLRKETRQFAKKAVKKIIAEKNIERKALMIRKAISLLGIKKNNRNFFENNNFILLKGPVDAIIGEKNIAFNKTGNAGMTKGGTGDVLAGLAAGFLAQSKDLLQSAVNAAYYNGLIGDILLKRKKGFTYLASDMVEEIKRVLKK